MAKAAQRRVGRAASCLLGAACVIGLSRSPLAFFAPSSPGPSTTETAVDSAAKVAAREANELFRAGPYFLKLAIPTRDYVNVRVRNIADKHGVRYRQSSKGQYHPWTITKSGLQKKTLTLSGAKEAISAAFSEIRDSTVVSELSFTDRAFTFLFPRSLQGELIGEGGEKVKRFEEETSSKAFINAHPGLESSLTVRGSLAADKAVEWLLSLAPEEAERRSAMLPIASSMHSADFAVGADCVIYVPVPQEKLGRVIGKRGERLTALSNEFHTKIDVDSEQGLVKLSGISGDVHALHTHLILGPLASE